MTEHDVATLRRHVTALDGVPRGVSTATLPALQTLADVLAALVQPPGDVSH